MKNLSRLLLIPFLMSQLALGAGKLQNEDFKTASQIVTAGGTIAQLLNDTKVYVTANGINSQLSTAITNGVIGGGTGGSGVELLTNPGFETGVSIGWTNTGGTFASVISGPNLLIGKGSATFQASATSQSVQSTLTAVPIGLFGRACAASVLYLGGDSNLTFEVIDGSSNILSSKVLSTATTAATASLSFICPSSGSFQWKIVSTASSALIAMDQAHLGDASAVQVSQARVLGSVSWPGTASCLWTRTSSSTFAPFPAVSACTLPSGSGITGSATAPATKIPAITFPSLGAGSYVVHSTGSHYNTGSAICSWGISDGTTLKPAGVAGSGSTDVSANSVSAKFDYTTGQSNITFDIEATGDGASKNCEIVNTNAIVEDLNIWVEYFPSQNKLAPSVDQVPQSWSGYQTVTSGWTQTGASFADPAAGSGIVLNQTTNRNMGTVTNAASSLPGITWTPAVAGIYHVCAQPQIASSATANPGARLVDGSSTIIHPGQTIALTSGFRSPMSLCGDYTVLTAGSPVTTKVQTQTDNGTATISDPGGGGQGAAIQWTISNADFNSAVPAFPGSVTSSSAGVERIERAQVLNVCSSSPCTLSSSSPGITSITRSSTGTYTANISAGVFSSAPTCIAAFISNSSNGDCYAGGLSGSFTSTSVPIYCGNSSRGAAADAGFSLVCTGPH